jgi:hypothetical protein
MPFKSSSRGAYGPQGQKVIKGPLAPVWVTSGTITQASTGTAYSFQLSATDDSGDAPSYSLSTGSLPAGLSISSSGLISGTPSSSGTFTFTANATDVNGRTTSSSTLSLTSIVPAAAAGTGQIFTSTGTQNYTIPQNGTYYVYCVGAGGNAGCGTGGSGGVSASRIQFATGTVLQVGVGMVGNSSYEMGGGTSGAAAGAGSFVKLVSGTSNVSSPLGNYLLVAGGGGAGGCHGFAANFGGNGNGQGGAQYDNNPPDNGCGGYSGWNGGGGGNTCHGGGNGGGTGNANQLTGANGNTASGNFGGSGGGGFGGGGGGMSGTGGTGNAGGYGPGWTQDSALTSYRRGGGGGGSHPNSCGGSGGGGGGLILGDSSDSRFAYGSYRVTPNRTTSNGSYDRGLNAVMTSLGRTDIANIGSYGAAATQGAVWIVASGLS